MITRQCLDNIKETIDIYDIVSPYVNLKKCGANWRGLSPFTTEKTPSFFVIPAKRMFKCFSSGNAGDLFRFIQLKENVSFVEAVEMIANKFNLKLEFDDKNKNDLDVKYSKKDLIEINEIANLIFIRNFNANDPFGVKIKDFWQKTRNFDLNVAKENGIGVCKNDEKFLLEKLSKQFSLSAIKESGLFYFKEDSNDLSSFKLRFRFRLTIPIRDIQGRIVGFSARAIPEITSSASDAKYINSPETSIFHKGNLLFGLHQARLHINEANQFWIVEGQFDVLRCWATGILTAVAPQGTAITDTQLSILHRYSPNLNCMFDGDEAGLRAADKLLHMSMSVGLEVKFYILPPSEDPDSFLKSCTQTQIKDFIKSSGMSAMEFAVKRYIPTPSLISGRQKADALQNIYEIIACTNSSIMHESLLDEVAQLCNFNRRAIGQDFNTFYQRKKFNNPLPVKFSIENSQSKNQKMDSAECQLLAICLDNANIAKKIANILDFEVLASLNSSEGKLLIKLLNEIGEGLWDDINSLNNSEIFSEEEKNVAYSVLAEFNIEEDILKLVNFCLMKLHSRFYRRKINELDKKISKISLDEKDMIRNLQRDRLYLREQVSLYPQIN